MAYGQDFDMKEYIRKRMLEITELKDREIFKETVGDVLSAIYDYNRNAYEELERRILDECAPSQNRYAVYISLTDRQHYDETDRFMYPMRQEDTKKTKISCQDVSDALSGGEQIRLCTVYIQGTAAQVGRLLRQTERRFSGAVKTPAGEYMASLCVKPAVRYMRMIEELYAVFGANFQPWLTVCTAYLTKLVDVYLCSSEQIGNSGEIDGIRIDFEEYAGMAKYNMIPLWNLRPMTEKTSTYPNPCVDKTNYEHQFFAQRLDPGCEYLVRDTDAEITNIRRLNGDLYVTCPIERPREWHLYEVHQRDGTEAYQYPVLSNRYKESFSGNITEMFRRSIKTKAEMARLIEAFDYGDYLTFCGYELCPEIPSERHESSYSMDSFLSDELRAGTSRQPLVIRFEARNPENYLNEDIMSFLVTQVQRIFPEYNCVGELI